MADNIFNPMELDAIGEVMNISLGSSATAVSNLLDQRVEITTPTVSVCDVEDFEIGELQPAVGVEIRYVSGLSGSNIMLLKRSDVKVIVDILMGAETPEEEFELNELTISAVCEVMNQMMGAASTALSDFLGYPVNISTPESFELNDFPAFKKEHFPVEEGKCVVVRFMLNIEGILHSEFINVMSVELTRKLLSGLGLGDDEDASQKDGEAPQPGGNAMLNQEEIERLMSAGQSPAAPEPAPQGGGGMMSQEEIERLMSGGQPPAPQPAPQGGGGMMSQEEIERLMSGGQPPAPQGAPPQYAAQPTMQTAPPQYAAQPTMQAAPPQYAPQPMSQPFPTSEGQVPAMPVGAYPMPPYGQYAPGYYPPPGYYAPPMPPRTERIINTKPAEMPQLANGDVLTEQQAENLDLLMSVPLEVSVEIGRARRKVQDVLAFNKGSLVMLNKLAGDQVDLFVNGQCIAKGDVVVVDDNFGIRITEVLKSPDLGEMVKGN